MNPRRFPFVRLLAAWLAMVLAGASLTPSNASPALGTPPNLLPPCEVRGAWLNHYAFKYETTRAATLAKAVQGNLNTLFVSAPPVGDNPGGSTPETFSALLQEAKALGLSVHAWVSNRSRPPGGKADFTSPAEQAAQAAWAVQLLTEYPELDGVHFDHIRYDKYEVSSTTGPYANLPRVDEAKTAGVSGTVQGAFEAIQRQFPGKKLTAAVFTISSKGHLSYGPYPADGPPYFWERNLPYHREVQQNVLGWINGGYLTGAIPMMYGMTDSYWNFEVDQWKGYLGDRTSSVYMGLGWLTEDASYAQDWGYDPPGMVRKIKYGRSQGIGGFVIFELTRYWAPGQGEIDWELIDALTVDSEINQFDAPFENPAPSCLASSAPAAPSAKSLRAPRQPSIDGQLHEYGRVPGFGFSDQSGRGLQDNQATVRSGWDDAYLYLAIQVTDTQLVANVTERDGPVWGDDAVEVFIDPRLDGGSSFSTDDYRIAVNLHNALADSRASFDGHRLWDGHALHQVTLQGTLNNDGDADTGYAVELAIPWSDLEMTPTPGRQLKLDVAVDDRDDPSSGYQYSDWAGLTNFNQPWAWPPIQLSTDVAEMPSFADVGFEHPYHNQIEALYQAGYTAGCSSAPLLFCPDRTMNRAESAVFVEHGIHDTAILPPQPAVQTFADLPLDSWAAKWAEALWQDHYTAGCGTDPLVYCPWQGHTRAEGCVFYLHMLNGPTYQPPQPSQQTFADVPLEAWYAKWVQAGYDAGLLKPCQTTPDLRFCPNDPLSRALAAYMMVQAKGLGIPGP